MTMESVALDPACKLPQRAARGALWGLVWAVAALGATGCAANAELQAEVKALRGELTGMRATTAAMSERLDALEMQGAGLRASGPEPAPAAAPSSDAPPDLKVVTLKPTPDEITTTEPAAAVETGPRVKIRSTPSGLVQEEVRGDEKDGEPTKAAPKKDPPKPTATKKPVSPAPKSPPAPAKP